ncbi:unnamed protein product, partial [Didymodactylos carnosus]
RRLQSFAVKQILYCRSSSNENQSKKLDKDLNENLFELVEFKQLLNQSDFVIITCSLNDYTRNLFNSNTFKQMKYGDCILINTARGGIVDQNALYDALISGQILAAVWICRSSPLQLSPTFANRRRMSIDMLQ